MRNFKKLLVNTLINNFTFLNKNNKLTKQAWYFIIGQNKNNLVLNTLRTFLLLKKNLNVIKTILSFWYAKKILFINLEPILKLVYLSFKKKNNEAVLHSKWHGGNLTNFKIFRKNLKRYALNKDDFNIQYFIKGLVNFRKLPTITVINNIGTEKTSLVNEIKKTSLLTIKSTDATENFGKLDYPMLTNTKSINLNLFYLKLYQWCIINGYKKRMIHYKNYLNRKSKNAHYWTRTNTLKRRRRF